MNAVKTYQAKMFKRSHIDGSKSWMSTAYFRELIDRKMVIELIYKDRRGTLKDGMKI